MRQIQVRITIRLIAGVAALVPFALVPQLAQAQAPGSLAQLTSPNDCVQATNVEGGDCPTSTAPALSGTDDAAVSPDGKDVYVISSTDDAIAEFSRGADGSLTSIGCISDPNASGTCDSTTSNGLINPQAIVVSPDGNNVYVAAQDSVGNGTIAEFTRDPASGSLSPVTGHDCIAENINATDETSPCADQTAYGIPEQDSVAGISALAISHDGATVYAVDSSGEEIAWFDRAADGSLTQTGGPNECIADANVETTECGSRANGIAVPTGVAVSRDGDNVYTGGSSGDNGTIAEFTRNANGSLTQLTGANNCIETSGDTTEGCGTTAIGVSDEPGLAISPDGRNVYVASEFLAGPIAEFSRGAGGALTQLAPPNDCYQEGVDLGCGMTGTGIASGDRLVVSPDGADVYAAAPSSPCDSSGGCSSVAEFARNPDGTLTQLASPDSCIQEVSVEGSECPGNENGTGFGGPGLAISPDGASVYVTGQSDIAEFSRTVPATLTVSLAGSGSGAVSDGTGQIACPTTCSHTYAAGSQVTLTATAGSGSTFAGWSGGGCSGTGACQVVMNADTAVTATFTSTAAPSPGSPTPVLTGAPAAVTDGGAGFSGSVNPEGLPTTAYFQYGLDKRYSQVGASGPDYTAQTQPQTVGSDFTSHGVGPVTVTGLVPNALYHVRLVATNSAGTAFGQDVTFTTAMAPAPGAPTLGKTFNIEPVSGLVLVYINGHLVPLTQLTQIPAGVAIDTRHGTLKIITATGGGGGAHDAAAKTQTGEFSGAVFRLSQQTRGAGKGLVTVMLALSAFKGAPSQAVCKNGAAGDAHAAKTNTKVIQLLHASAHGKFRTSGRYSAATVLGTIWTVTARCDGTLTHAIKDEVEVTDFVRHKTIVLHAGQSYLAPAGRKHG